MSRLEKFVEDAKEFAQKNITAKDPNFIAWNNSLIRYMEKNYGINSTTTLNFKNRQYSLGIYAIGTQVSSFINAYQQGMAITVKELEFLLEEEKENYELNTDTEKFSIEHKCAFMNTLKTRLIPIQENSLLTK